MTTRAVSVYRREANLCPPADPDGANSNRCLYCGRTLRRTSHAEEARQGDYGDNAFCGLRCGYMFGVAFASFGHRLKPASKLPDETKTRYVYPECPTCGKRMKLGDSQFTTPEVFCGHCCDGHFYKVDKIEEGKQGHKHKVVRYVLKD